MGKRGSDLPAHEVGSGLMPWRSANSPAASRSTCTVVASGEHQWWRAGGLTGQRSRHDARPGGIAPVGSR